MHAQVECLAINEKNVVFDIYLALSFQIVSKTFDYLLESPGVQVHANSHRA